MQFPCVSHGKTLNCHSEFRLLHTSALSEKQIRKKVGEIFQFPFLNVYRDVEISNSAHGRLTVTGSFSVLSKAQVKSSGCSLAHGLLV